MRTFVISLADASQRRQHMESQLSNLGIGFEFRQAVNGANLSDHEIKQVYNVDEAKQTSWGKLNKGEIGCALSHIGLWKKIVDENISSALIFEDDAVISPDLNSVLAGVEQMLKPNDVVNLGATSTPNFYFFQRHLPGDHRLVYVNQAFYNAHAYIITKGAAARLSKKALPLAAPIDFWYSDIGFRGVTPIRAIVPALAEQASLSDLPSQIGGRQRQLSGSSSNNKQRSWLRQKIRQIRLGLKNRFFNWPACFN